MKNILSIFLFLFHINSFAASAEGEVLGQAATGAATGAATNMAAQQAGQSFFKETAGKIGDFFDSPPGILTVSGIGAAYSYTLYDAAAKQEKECEENIEKINKLLATLTDTYKNHCPNGRDDLTQPRCYCYTEDLKKNMNRTNSKMCQDLWAADAYKLQASSAEDPKNPMASSLGCITKQGQFDENCNCKKTTSGSGNNCISKLEMSIPGGMASVMRDSGLQDVMGFVSNAGSGLNPFNRVSSGTLALRAIKGKQHQSNLLNQIQSKIPGGVPVQLINESDVNKVAAKVFGQDTLNKAQGIFSSPLANFDSASSSDPNLKDLMKKTGLADSLSSGRGLGAGKKAEAKNDFNFNLSEPTANNQNGIQNFDTTPEKKYKINDINKNTDTSIFEILSNRYMQSGLRRLFDDEEQK